MITVKCEHQSDYRRFTIDGDSSFKELKNKIASLFGVGDFVIKYKDQEGDWITVSTDMELQESLKNNIGTLKLSIWATDPSAENKHAVDPLQLQNALLKLVDTVEFKDRLVGLFKDLIASDSLRQVLCAEPIESVEPTEARNNLPSEEAPTEYSRAKEILGDDAVVISESVNFQPIEPIVEAEAIQEQPKEEVPIAAELAQPQPAPAVDGLGVVQQLSTASTPSVATSTIQLPELSKSEEFEKIAGPQEATMPESPAPEEPKQPESPSTTFMRATEVIGTPIFNFIDSFISPKPTHDPKWNPALEQLKEMGFTDIKKNVELLEKHSGLVEQVLDILLTQS